ncbi:hypothetical protein RFN58_06920 [Streptomyces iakyrus]|uniref:hypothetical protein n=1 Tax=Streptomyces iakyrus TaxID=68219 RepID=UPI0005241978|nr:hypothetical protein [Streptomyces iakyrus]
MSTPTPPQPDFPPPLPPEPPKPAKSRTNAIIIGAAAAVIAAIVATGIVVANSRDDGSPAAEASAPADPTVTAAADEPEPEPSDTEPEIMGLTDGVAYEDGVEVTLSGYKRGVSSEYASPESTPYVSFTVKIDNKSDKVADIATGYISCYYGDDSKEGEQVFDSDRGLEGVPSMRLRPGRTATAKVGCEMPKDEVYLQIELTPTMDSETAIFAGSVK